MADNKPTKWSLSKNPPIGNYGTIVDARLTTITPQNPRGYIPLEVPSTNNEVSNLFFAIEANGKVTYAQVDTTLPASDPNYIIRQYNNIQEISNRAAIDPFLGANYTAQTSDLIKDQVAKRLKARTDIIIVKKTTEPSPYAPPSGGPNPPAGSSSGGSSVPQVSAEQNKQVLDTISKGEKARTNYEKNLKYPETYDGNDYTILEMIRYVPSRNLGLGSIASDADSGMLQNSELGLPRIDERSQNEAVLTSITLPIPANLIDANPVDWTNEGLNPLQAYGATAIGGILNSGNIINGIGAEAGRAANTLRNNSDAAKTILNNEIIKQILGVNTLTRTTGAIVNPNTELLFKGPSLRSFTFSFKMTPRNQKEAASIKKIVRTLKQGASIKRGIRGIFLSSPNVFRVKFYYSKPVISESGEIQGQKGEYPHPYLPVLKVCALQNISVNYMPDGSYMTYGDGSMVAYDMTLTFAEISPIFDDDYDELDKEVGGKNSDGNPLSQDTIIGY